MQEAGTDLCVTVHRVCGEECVASRSIRSRSLLNARTRPTSTSICSDMQDHSVHEHDKDGATGNKPGPELVSGAWCSWIVVPPRVESVEVLPRLVNASTWIRVPCRVSLRLFELQSRGV